MALDGALGSILVAGDAGDAAALCVAGVALGDIHLFVSRGRRGTWRHLPSFCEAGVALMALGGALQSVLVALCVAEVAHMIFLS